MTAHIPTDFQKLGPIQLSGPPQKANYESFKLGPLTFKIQSHKLTMTPRLYQNLIDRHTLCLHHHILMVTLNKEKGTTHSLDETRKFINNQNRNTNSIILEFLFQNKKHKLCIRITR